MVVMAIMTCQSRALANKGPMNNDEGVDDDNDQRVETESLESKVLCMMKNDDGPSVTVFPVSRYVCFFFRNKAKFSRFFDYFLFRL